MINKYWNNEWSNWRRDSRMMNVIVSSIVQRPIGSNVWQRRRNHEVKYVKICRRLIHNFFRVLMSNGFGTSESKTPIYVLNESQEVRMIRNNVGMVVIGVQNIFKIILKVMIVTGEVLNDDCPLKVPNIRSD